MTEQQFCYWLWGFVELMESENPSPRQWQAITDHLNQVFDKKTPDRRVTLNEITNTKPFTPSYRDILPKPVC